MRYLLNGIMFKWMNFSPSGDGGERANLRYPYENKV